MIPSLAWPSLPGPLPSLTPAMFFLSAVRHAYVCTYLCITITCIPWNYIGTYIRYLHRCGDGGGDNGGAGRKEELLVVVGVGDGLITLNITLQDGVI